MKYLIIGGSASGKSEYAENICKNFGEKKLYIATMKIFDEESEKRVDRHREMRKQKGFDTAEVYKGLQNFSSKINYDVVLLECMSNLLANEMFSDDNTNFMENIIRGIENLSQRYKNLVVVSNDVFSDINNYSEDTLNYIKNLGFLNQYMAKNFNKVIEVYYGIPIVVAL